MPVRLHHKKDLNLRSQVIVRFTKTSGLCGFSTRHAVLTLPLCLTDDDSASVEDKVRKVRQDGSVYKWDLKEDDAGK